MCTRRKWEWYVFICIENIFCLLDSHYIPLCHSLLLLCQLSYLPEGGKTACNVLGCCFLLTFVRGNVWQARSSEGISVLEGKSMNHYKILRSFWKSTVFLFSFAIVLCAYYIPECFLQCSVNKLEQVMVTWMISPKLNSTEGVLEKAVLKQLTANLCWHRASDEEKEQKCIC